MAFKSDDFEQVYKYAGYELFNNEFAGMFLINFRI